MNEQEAEEQGTFLKGALGALENLAHDIEKQRLEAHLLENKLVGLKAEAYKIRGEIEKYFGLEGKQPSAKILSNGQKYVKALKEEAFDELSEEEKEEIKRGN